MADLLLIYWVVKSADSFKTCRRDRIFRRYVRTMLIYSVIVRGRSFKCFGKLRIRVISAVTSYLLPASKRRSFYLVGYVQAQQFCVSTLHIDCRFDSNDVVARTN